MHIKIEVEPFNVPDRVLEVGDNFLRTHPLSAVSTDDLSVMCHVFRESVFNKVGKVDPESQAEGRG